MFAELLIAYLLSRLDSDCREERHYVTHILSTRIFAEVPIPALLEKEATSEFVICQIIQSKRAVGESLTDLVRNDSTLILGKPLVAVECQCELLNFVPACVVSRNPYRFLIRRRFDGG